MTETVTEEVVNKADLYSRITEVHITNFMSFERAVIHVPEEGIVGIRGYNNTGKSAILRAIACCLLNKYSYNHKAFIKDGKSFFQVDVVFSDTVTVRYEKHSAGSALYEMYEGDTLLYTNKQQNGSGFYEKIIGVPEEIAVYLGMSNTEEGMSLNYGLNTEKQLLVSTSGSENYQALNQVLRSQDLGLASQLINRENNAISGSISHTEAQIQMKSRELGVFDALEESLIGRVSEYAESVSRYERLEGGFGTLVGLVGGLREITPPELPTISSESITRVRSIETLITEAEALKGQVAPEIPTISEDKITVIEQLNKLGSFLNPLRETVAPEITPVMGIERFAGLVSLGQAVGVIREAEKSVKECEHLSEKAKIDSAALSKELKEAGHKVVTCGNCGELTLA